MKKTIIKSLFGVSALMLAMVTLVTIIYFGFIDSDKSSYFEFLKDSLKFYAMTALGVGIVTGVLFGSVWMFSKLYSRIFKEEE